MNRLLIILFIVFGSSYQSYGQFEGTVHKDEFTQTDVSVNLFTNKKFLIELITCCDGDIYGYGLSTGDYRYVKDTIILTDTYYKYTLKFIRKKNELIPMETYLWMMNVKLTSYDRADFRPSYKNYANRLQNYYTPLMCRHDSKRYRLYYREYKAGDYTLVLKHGNTYTCSIDNFVVSEGKFVYNGNCIKFQNNQPDFSFTGTVDYYNICLGFIPFRDICFPNLQIRK